MPARLADLLVESLDTGELGSLDRLWVDEAKRRRDGVRSGLVLPILGTEALQAVRDAPSPAVSRRGPRSPPCRPDLTGRASMARFSRRASTPPERAQPRLIGRRT